MPLARGRLSRPPKVRRGSSRGKRSREARRPQAIEVSAAR